MNNRASANRLWSTTAPANEPAPNQATGEYESQGGQAHRNGYIPFTLRDRADRLLLRPISPPSRYPLYGSLLDIAFDHDHQGTFSLIYSFMVAEVTGVNLGAIVHAIDYGQCSGIYQYNPKSFNAAPDPDKALVEGIKVIAAVDKLLKRS